MRKVKKYKPFNTIATRDKILELANLIREGEEEHLQEYDELVQYFVEKTCGNAAAKDSDPLMWDELCENWGKEPGTTIGPGERQFEMCYWQMVKFRQGYWK